MTRMEEITERIGARPALIRMANAADHFGEAAPYRIEDGVAIIDIIGPLSNDRWSWGGTTYGDIQYQVKIATADPNVKAILLNVNSPGGETDNAFETAALISAAGEQKPCWAVAATMAYSAGYLLASQAERIYCSQTTGGVGSIGVYCAHLDLSGMLEKAGVKVTLISAGDGKTDGNPYEPLSDSARASLQEEVDRLYGEFVGAVARGRNLAPQAIVKLGARTFDGAARATGSGLADVPGDLTAAWVDLCSELQRPQMPTMRGGKGSVASATRKAGQMTEEEITAEANKQQAAVDVEALVAQAKAEGFAEASVIVDLCTLAGVSPAMSAQFISERKTAEQVRKALLADRVAAEKGRELNTQVMPGADAAAAEEKPAGKTKPWSEILRALGWAKREGK